MVKFLRIIQNMYSNSKSRIVHDNSVSDIFMCEIGVRQGEIVPPLLFSLYLNDLTVFLKLYLLLYADDTILLAESREDLQFALNTFAKYCREWKLKINTNKKEVLIFSQGRISNTLNYFINNE